MNTRSNSDFLNMPDKLLSIHNRSLVQAIVTGSPIEHIGPTVATLDPTLDCNARCAGCVEDLPMRQAGRQTIPRTRALEALRELRELGLRAIELYGGEPLHVAYFGDLIQKIDELGLRLGIVTNGALLDKHIDVLSGCRALDWLRVSINAGTAESHQRMFRFVDDNRFDAILRAVAALAKRGLNIGFSYVVTPHNAAEICGFARRCDDLGVAYLELKPLIHPETKHLVALPLPVRQEVRRQIEAVENLQGHCHLVITDSLRLVLEADNCAQLHQPKGYAMCLVSLFRAVVTPLAQPGVVVSCPYHRTSPAHVVGSLSQPLDQAWLCSPQRVEALMGADPQKECGFWCNRHATNQALWDLRQRYAAGEHDVLDRLPLVERADDCWL